MINHRLHRLAITGLVLAACLLWALSRAQASDATQRRQVCSRQEPEQARALDTESVRNTTGHAVAPRLAARELLLQLYQTLRPVLSLGDGVDLAVTHKRGLRANLRLKL